MRELSLTLTALPDSRDKMIVDSEEAQLLLSQQLDFLIQLKQSPEIKMILKQVTTLEARMVLIQDTLEYWASF